jgi:hypothetical protein
MNTPNELLPVEGLVGPRFLDDEEYREYSFGGTVYHIDSPVAYYYREGGTTHRVVTADGVVHCVPAPGVSGCVLRWKSKSGRAVVAY